MPRRTSGLQVTVRQSPRTSTDGTTHLEQRRGRRPGAAATYAVLVTDARGTTS
ncbi:MAG: hypothetical protein IPM81_14635 [Saprospirales bacterium]|nr:hypothetical protein [Saprospirales bacterium]